MLKSLLGKLPYFVRSPDGSNTPPRPVIRSRSVPGRGHGGNQCGIHLPSPWIGQFERQVDLDAALEQTPGILDAFSYIDDQMVASRHPRQFPAYCTVCGSVQTMRIDWALAGASGDGSIHPAWTETSVCEGCRLNSRMRAVASFVLQHPDYTHSARCYLAERVTVSYPVFAKCFDQIEASEYLGDARSSGEEVFLPEHQIHVRHEDLTQLSFPDGVFDWVVTQDVFEHIPNYRAAFRECARILAPGGKLVFSVPFNGALARTCIRARVTESGEVEHLLPPEIHGNPVSGDGALCFQNFGWDMLDTLRDSSFVQASAHAYWAPWMGFVGLGGFVFLAQKAA